MNPQFSNMAGGMGRGMPNMTMNMNPGMPMNNMNNVNMSQANPAAQVTRYIYHTLTQQNNTNPPPIGWKKDMTPTERARQIKCLFDSLRMLAGAMDTKHALDEAINFETKQFQTSTSREQYQQSVHDRLARIRDERQTHINNASAANNAMANNSATNLPLGLQQGQQQLSQQQNMTFPHQMQQTGQPTMQQLSMSNPIHAQSNVPQASMAMNPGNLHAPSTQAHVASLSVEDKLWISTRAADLAKQTTLEQRRLIKEQMNPRERAAVEAKGVDPVMWHFNVRAQKDFRMRQAHGAQMHANASGSTSNPMAMTNAPMQPNMTPGNAQAATPFMHTIDPNHIRSQQEAGMRSQQEGQLVVPVSNPPQNKDMTPMQQQQMEQRRLLMQRIRAANPNMSQQEMHAKMTQALQSMQQRQVQEHQAKLQQMQANARLAAQQQMNLGPNLAQNMPNGGPNPNQFPTINRPMNPSIANAGPMQHPGISQNRSQPGQAAQPGNNKEFANMLIQLTNQYPELKERLRREHQSKWGQIVANFQNEIQSQKMNGPAVAMTTQRSQGPPANRLPGGQSIPMTTSLSAGQMSNLAPHTMAGMMPNQQAMNVNQAAFAGSQGQLPPNRGQMHTATLTPAEQQQMHRVYQESHMQPIPPHILNNIKAQYTAQGKGFPPQLHTWHQWKSWTRTQPDAPVTEQRLNEMHQRFIRHSFEMQRNNAQGPGPMTQPPNQVSFQAPLMAPQMSQQDLSQPSQPPFPPQVEQIFSQRQARIDQFKAQNPQHQRKSDEELSKLLNIPSLAALTARFKAQLGRSHATMPAGMQPMANASSRPSQTPVQPNASQFLAQNPAGPRQQQQQQQPPQPPQPPQNNLKRPSEDTPTIPVPNTLNTFRPALTEEQINQLPPEQQKKFLENKKRAHMLATVAKLIADNDKTMKAPAPILNMDLPSKQRIASILTSKDMIAMLSRFEQFLATLIITDNGVLNTSKTIVKYRWMLLKQFTPESVANKTFQPAPVFSLGPDEVETIFNFMKTKISHAATKTQASKQSNVNTTAPNHNNNNMPLTQENLEAASAAAHEQQQRKISPGQKVKDGPPPAPTATQPPFQFPADKGQGLPLQYGTPRFDAKNLQLPANKRPRNNQAVSTPAKAEAVTAPVPSVSCVFPACGAAPFTSKAAFDEHVKLVHQPEMESQNDPLGFLNNTLQQAFNLDESLQPRKPALIKPEGRAVAAVKAERGTTPTLGLGAMTRGSSLGGPKSPPNVKKLSPKMAKADDVKQAMQIPDSWKSASFTLEDMANVFGAGESGDVVPFKCELEQKEQAVIDSFLSLDEWKCLRDPIDDVISSEGASIKSNASPENDQASLPKRTTTVANSDPFYVDTHIEGMPYLENDFDAMFKKETEDWEMIQSGGELPPLTNSTQQPTTNDDWLMQSFDHETQQEQQLEDEAMAWAETINWDEV